MANSSTGTARREAIAGGAACVALAATGSGGAVSHAAEATIARDEQGEHRILSLRLQTAASLDEMRDYYDNVLELDVERASDTELEVRAGFTNITFVKVEARGDAPFYHFAFNIPENKVKAAHDWQAQRGPLMPTPKYMQDPDFPAEVRHFRNWNAHSVFFWDPAGNILEHIGRHTLKNAAQGPFSANDIQYVSEIALVTDDVPAMAKKIEDRFRLPQYFEASNGFHAIGDEHGLLLVFKRGRTSGAAVEDPQKFDVFPADVAIRHDDSLSIPDSPYRINETS